MDALDCFLFVGQVVRTHSDAFTPGRGGIVPTPACIPCHQPALIPQVMPIVLDRIQSKFDPMLAPRASASHASGGPFAVHPAGCFVARELLRY